MTSRRPATNGQKALQDIVHGTTQYRIWTMLAWQKVRQRYRRSTLGPLWLTLSMAIQMSTMGVLVTFLFGHRFERYLPYLCLGLIIWNFYSAILNSGTSIFIEYSNFIKNLKRPYFGYVLSHIFKTMIEAAHNFLVYLVIAVVFLVYPGANFWWLLITIPICLINVTWMAFFLAIVSTRFRDIPMIVQSAMGVLFWLTPIIYFPDQLGDKVIILQFNPFYHLLDILRLPILNQAPTATNLIVSALIAVIGWIATINLFSRYRSRIPFWL